MKTYYILWMPTLAELKTPCICRNKVIHKLEDSIFLGGYYLRGEIDSSLNITIEYWRTGFVGFWEKLIGKSHPVIKLHKESDILRNGFIQYSCELPDTGLDEIQKGLAGMMRTPIYHFVKEFFHKHTHHHSSQDSLLQAYVSTTLVDINASFDEVVVYYIKQYRDLLTDFEEVTPQQIEVSKKRINKTHKVQQSIATLGDVIKAGNELNGQLRYMDFLLNKVARSYSVSKELRTEIERLRKNVQVILNDASTSYNVSTAALGVKYGIQGIKWGIGGVVVSCTLFAISTYLSLKDDSTEQLIDKATNTIIKKDSVTIVREMDSIRKDVKLLEKRVDKQHRE